MGTHSTLKFTRPEAIKRLVEEKLAVKKLKYEQKYLSVSDNDIEDELDVLLDKQFYNAVIVSDTEAD